MPAIYVVRQFRSRIEPGNSQLWLALAFLELSAILTKLWQMPTFLKVVLEDANQDILL